MTKKEKKRRLVAIHDQLAALYPDATCYLQYGGEPWRLLVMGRLSAQCTDERVNAVSVKLFERYPTPHAMAEADIGELEGLVRSCGLYRTKAAQIREASAVLLREHGGRLPEDMDALLRLPGVGRKIANLLLGDVFGHSVVVTDTHCIRICGRWGMYPEKLKNPAKIEQILKELLPVEIATDFCHRVVAFGREYCMARQPACDACPVGQAGLCEWGRK
ncbi:MAG: endonuclease III [Eubacteriales bacterium]